VTCLWAFAALAVVWFFSVWFDVEWWDASGVRGGISRGRLVIDFDVPWPGYQSGWQIAHEWIARERRPLIWESEVRWEPNWRRAAIPIWQILFWIGAVTVIAWRLDVISERRARRGMCRGCGYDLAGIAKGARCPECGREVRVAG